MVGARMHAAKEADQTRRRGDEGYSLLEVLIVLTIIALIAALVGPRLISQLDRSKVTAARVQIRSLMASVDTMRLDIGRYPTAEEGLELLVRQAPAIEPAEGWQGPYLEADIPKDPWGRDYVYAQPLDDVSPPQLKSLGADGREGGTGLAADIVYTGAR